MIMMIHIQKEINFMKLIIDSNIPYLGICLGAQFLAKYLGSSIFKNKNKLSEIGFYKITPTTRKAKNYLKIKKYFINFILRVLPHLKLYKFSLW